MTARRALFHGVRKWAQNQFKLHSAASSCKQALELHSAVYSKENHCLGAQNGLGGWGAGGLGLGLGLTGWCRGVGRKFPPSCGCAPVAGAVDRGAAANKKSRKHQRHVSSKRVAQKNEAAGQHRRSGQPQSHIKRNAMWSTMAAPAPSPRRPCFAGRHQGFEPAARFCKKKGLSLAKSCRDLLALFTFSNLNITYVYFLLPPYYV